jgi:branched-chain amino acid transport system ATP-binding protein
MLKISELDAHIERTPILRQVNLELPADSMVGLIGRNGAGKTTLMRSIMGLIRPTSGSIEIDGLDVTARASHERAGFRVGYMPEDRRLVPDLTVEENILVPGWSTELADLQARLSWIYELMPEVQQFADRKALQLSGGQQKLVALARALLIGHKLLLLDEPFEGIAPALSHRLIEVLGQLKSEGHGLSVLLSESDYTHSADVVDHVYTIERGEVSEGTID